MAKETTKKNNEGSGKHCVVVGCKNTSKKLRKWKLATCELHASETHEYCVCLQPYKMHRFPNCSNANSAANRKQWVRNINRKDFRPSKYSTVCSVHFEEGKPTSAHPYPTVAMGYIPYKQLSRGRPPPRRRVSTATKAVTVQEKAGGVANMSPHGVERTSTCVQTQGLETKDASVQWYDARVADHTYAHVNPITKSKAKGTQTVKAPEVSAVNLQESDMKFYTGLSVRSFWALVNALVVTLTTTPKFQLPVPDQLLLVLMRLRIALMIWDLGVRFKVSCSTVCDIISFWVPRLATFMRENVIFWPSRDTLARIRPKCFESCHPKATCIIDCTEIFVQRPKNLRKRAQTYSNYKHHNTYKALYCIAPNGFVTYVSKLFGGRASDTFISQNSGFLDHLLPGDEVLADRAFTIEDILPHGVKLSIPAFTRGLKDRRLPEESVTETRRIANVRIHVERAIRRLKCFKILANIIPMRVKNVDDILITCAGLCNLQPCLINEDRAQETSDSDSNDEEGNVFSVEE
ncbi:uncharacterized protein LOC119739132 [Patiria miniata]|uniref:THAP-type domain-containing protein n=1 Tax=Patiria miniata TaxID=46514 RepID=A0A914B271_PATMI|nr:uncharacterized protein LOC119739132 [Patiria miniata]